MSEETMGTITDIKRFSTHDGPGIRTTLFLKGCPLKCAWCSNPETQKPYPELYFIPKRCQGFGACVCSCSEKAISAHAGKKIDREKCCRCFRCVTDCPHGSLKKVGRKISVPEAMAEIEKDEPFFDGDGGLTLSGGEPLFQPDFSVAILKACREKKISTVVDTSGYASPETIKTIIPLTDLFLLDLKHMFVELHLQETGVSNEVILKNARLMAEKAVVRISFPLVPGFNDSLENLNRMGEFVKSIGVDTVDINPLHTLGTDKYRYLGIAIPYRRFNRPSPKEIKAAIQVLESYGLKTTVGRMM